MTDHGPRRVATPANGARGLVNTITPPTHPPGRRTASSRSPQRAPRPPRTVESHAGFLATVAPGGLTQAAWQQRQPGEAAPKNEQTASAADQYRATWHRTGFRGSLGPDTVE